MQKKIIVAVALVIFFSGAAQVSEAKTTDELYSEINEVGDFIDGNEAPIKYDKPVIRPSYVGKSILDDYLGPNGKFEVFFSGKDPVLYNEGQIYSLGNGVTIRNVGFHEGKKLALTISYSIKSPTWFNRVFLTREGGLVASSLIEGIQIRLVYDDGLYQTPVKDVYVELPILSEKLAPVSRTNIKSSNLKRWVFNKDMSKRITNVVSRENVWLVNSLGNNYTADTLQVIHKFYSAGEGTGIKEVEQTAIFDNNEPLVLSEVRFINTIALTTLFKSTMKTPGEINYLQPRTNGAVNTTKFEANFDMTQALNDGYEQYFPDTMSVVMVDHEKKFNALQLSTATFTDKDGNDISNLVETVVNNEHELEFKLKKSDLMTLGSNQLNIVLSADNLNNKEVLKGYDEAEKVYKIPMTFYNYKIYKGEKTESDKMIAEAKINPNIYGEAVEGVTADQYTTSSDLDVDDLVKNVATTIPGDGQLVTTLLDKDITFDTVKTYTLRVEVSSKETGKSIIISVPVSVIKAIPVISAFFENQSWLINEVNQQFKDQDKAIDKNLYLSDLLKITKLIDTNSAVKYTGQHIPKTISALKNLEWLELWDKELVGELPSELGELGKLQKLIIFGSHLTGTIPDSLGDLSQLKQLSLDNNKLTGTLPASLSGLTQLVELTVSSNQLVGQVPAFPANQLEQYNVSYNQVTYNDEVAPVFIPRSSEHAYTLMAKRAGEEDFFSWFLSGIKALALEKDGTVIKPFDPNDSGYFDLKLASGLETPVLYPTHSYTFINKKTGKTVYEGPADKELMLTVNLDEDYQVILDGATKNPNNRLEITGKRRELKLVEIPKQLSVNLKAGDLSSQPVKIVSKDALTLFDNRLNSQWKLRLKPSQLANATQSLIGSYYYTTKNNQTNAIPVDGFKEIEQGDSEPNSDSIPISAGWTDSKGLQFKQESTANHKGTYTGKLEWQLVDAPGP